MYTGLTRIVAALGLALAADALPAQSVAMPGEPVTGAFQMFAKQGNPLDHLPPGARLIAAFGERPAFSPDGRKVAFIGKSYGDAFEYDLATGETRNLTAHFPNMGFLRVHYMRDGSYLLLGPRREGANREATRNTQIELWWMDAKGTGPIVPLGVHTFEGIAVSRISNRIAWAELNPRVDRIQTEMPGTTTLKIGRIEMVDGKPTLTDTRALASKPFGECLLEPQDFFDQDRQLTHSCYVVNSNHAPGAGLITESQVWSISLADGKITHYPTPRQFYAEVEGIFPDGRRTLVECGSDQGRGLDLCLLELTPDHPRYTRLTHVLDYGEYRYSNPVVSSDGRKIAFQFGLAADEAGVGRGVLVMDLPKGF